MIIFTVTIEEIKPQSVQIDTRACNPEGKLATDREIDFADRIVAKLAEVKSEYPFPTTQLVAPHRIVKYPAE